MIHVDEISKHYNGVKALKGISFSVEKGELFGLIGPDGAGKTSLFRIIATLLLPDAGKVHINHLDVIKDYKAIRKSIGYMPGKFSLYPDLSVEENLKFFAAIFHTTVTENYDNIRSIYEQIAPFKNRKAGALSGGMKQKLALCCALVHNPEVLLLDEPTTGVDAVSRKEFWETLQQLKSRGMTILVSTPYMDEASLCDRIALIQSGSLLDTNTPDNMVHNFDTPLWAVQAADSYKLLLDIRKFTQTASCFPFGENIHITLKEPEALAELKQYLQKNDHQQLKIEPVSAGIEDVFMKLMQDAAPA